MLDLSTARVESTLQLDAATAAGLQGPAVPTLARYEPHASLLCLSGSSGTVVAYDARAGARPAGRSVAATLDAEQHGPASSPEKSHPKSSHAFPPS